MADALLKLPDDSANTGKQLDTTSLTVSGQTVHRERMTVTGATDVALAAVLNAAPTTDYGLVVRTAGNVLDRANDGTNSETALFDIDSGAGAQYVRGVSHRKAASGGSVEYGYTASATLANVAASASNVTLLASNVNRSGATFYNDSTIALYLKFGATASTSSFTVKIFGNGYYELPFPIYTGIIDGIWDSASGNLRVTELG